MSEDSRSRPKIEALEKILAFYTVEQMNIIAEHTGKLHDAGYGKLTIKFENGEPRLIAWEITRKLPYKTEFD